MNNQMTTFNGVVRGKTIELDHEPGLADGQHVTVTVRAAGGGEPGSAAGEGIRRSAGAWADDGVALQEYLEWSRQLRKQGRRGLEP